jgi:hypothetical protein
MEFFRASKGRGSPAAGRLASRTTWRIALFSMCLSCEPYPLIAAKIELPPGVHGETSQLHLETSSGRRADFAPKWETSGFSEIEATEGGFDVLFPTRIGTETFTYARVWLDVNRNGIFDDGDVLGDLAPAPFRATDRGALRCASNKNLVPPIRLKPSP